MNCLSKTLLMLCVATCAYAAPKEVLLTEGLLTQGYALNLKEGYEVPVQNYVSFYLKGAGTFTAGKTSFTLNAGLCQVIQSGKIVLEWRVAGDWAYFAINLKTGEIYVKPSSEAPDYKLTPEVQATRLMWQVEGIVGNIVTDESYVKNGPRI